MADTGKDFEAFDFEAFDFDALKPEDFLPISGDVADSADAKDSAVPGKLAPGQPAGNFVINAASAPEEHWDCAELVRLALVSWQKWLRSWSLQTARTRNTLCRKCTGSPLVTAAGFTPEVPHQVKHALIARMHRIIDKRVNELTKKHLPLLMAELEGAEVWRDPLAYDPRKGLDPAYDGLALDPEPLSPQEPFLFTLAELAYEKQHMEALPRPPLTESEKQQLRLEISRADEFSSSVGQQVCFALADYKQTIVADVSRFVVPQINDLLAHLADELDSPPQ